MRILVSGAGGFVGTELVRSLLAAGHEVHGAVRRPLKQPVRGVEYVTTEDLGGDSDWTSVLAGVDVVVHLAARVHVMRDAAGGSLAAYRSANALGTQSLARAAAQAGTRRLVFVSSIKVNGEATFAERPFTDADPPRPQDPYAQSKWEAEQALADISRETGLETVVLRPPLVYGPGVKANFLALLRWVDRGFPLPLGCIDNRRSLLYLGNLVDALLACCTHPGAAGRTFLVSDTPPVSTPELVRMMASVLGCPPRLLPVPVVVLRGLAGLLGRAAAVDRLTQSLVVDGSGLERALDWRPPFTMTQSLEQTCAWYRISHPSDQ